ncbi:MAG: glycoside hydrolase family 11 protein [Treponema sp.]|nr:glycoside hydrolase family 11 protein [Treponema sp.]
MKKHFIFNVFMLVVVFFFLIACKEPEDSSEGSITLQGGDANINPTTQTTQLTGGTTFTSNSGGNKSLAANSPYGYEMWTQGGNANKLTWYGANQGGGAAFKAEWNNPNDFLGRIGYYFGNGSKYASYGNLYCGFNYTRSGRSTAGGYSYIGIYGWSRNPLIEYYIVEDWFGNQWQSDTGPMGAGTTQGTVQGNFTVDGSNYIIYKSTRTNAPSIDGTKTFTQYFSVRQSPRKSGTISITEHFKKWEALGMKLGNMYEVKFLVEAGGGTGWFDASYLTFYQK